MSFSALGADSLRKAFGGLSVAQRNNLSDPFAASQPDFQGLGDVWKNLPVAQQTSLAASFQTAPPTQDTSFGIPTTPLNLTGQTFGGPSNEYGLPTQPINVADYFGGAGGAPSAPQNGFGTVPANSAGPGSLGGEYAVLDQYDPLFQQAAAQTGMPVNTLKAIAAVERGWEGTSVAGAQGIMQVMPFWGQDFGLNLQDPAQNILAGAKVLQSNYQQYGDMDTAIRAYLGFGTDAYGTTDQGYLQRVKGFEQQLNAGGGSFGASRTANLPTTTNYDAGNPVGNSIVQQAMQYVGVPYVWGGIPGKGDNPWDSGWDCCLVGETRIYGPNLCKRIDEVKPGDYVWTWQDGKLAGAEVTNAWFSKRQPVYRVRTRGRSVVASANHPFLVVRTHQRGPQARAITEWVRLDELKRGDYLVTMEDGDTGGVIVNRDIAWLLGLILGDGNLNDRHLNLCVYGSKRERAASILRTITGNQPLFDDKHGIVISAKRFCDQLRHNGYAKPAHLKRVPHEVWSWDVFAQAAFLDGYRDADGHIPANTARHGERTYASSSPDLINDIRALHMIQGENVGNISVNRRAMPITIKGKRVKKARPLHAFTVWSQNKAKGAWANTKSIRDFVAAGDGRWTVRPVLDITPMGEADTYDLEVAGVGNFVADGVVVHNSGMTYWLDQNYGSGQLPMGSHYQYQYAQQTGQLFTDPNQLQPGDIVFIDTGWYGGAGGNLNRAGHVGMYIGNGQIINAANPSSGTIVSPLNGSGTVLGAMHMAWSGGGGYSGGATGGGGYAAAPTAAPMNPQQRLIALLRGA